VELQVPPPLAEYCKVPPEPLTVPIDIEPPPKIQFVQVLFTMASAPVGADGVTQAPGTVVPTRVLVLRHPSVPKTLALITWAGPSWSYTGMVELQLIPPSVEYCKVPPVPLTVPIEMEPPLSTQFVQVLFTIASVPVGAAGAPVHVPGTVVPTTTLVLRHPFVARTLA